MLRRMSRADGGRSHQEGDPPAGPREGAASASVGQKIKEARLARGLTQEQLAGEEYTKAFVSAVEREESGISDQALEIFARRLDIPVEHFRISQRSFDMTMADVERLLHAGDVDEALRRLSALAATGTLQRAQVPVLQRAIAQAHLDAGRAEEALALLLQVLPDFETLDDRAELERTRLLIGVAHYRHGNVAEAMQTHQLCLKAVTDGVGSPRFAAQVYVSLGNEHVALGNYTVALAHYADAVRFAEEAEDPRHAAASHWGLSVAYKERGDLEAALRHARFALAMYELLGNRRLVGQIDNAIGIVHAQMGNWERARQCYEATLDLAEATDDTAGRAQALLNLVEYYTATGHLDEALERLPAALEQAAGTGQPFYEVSGLLYASRTYLAAGLLDEAADHARRAMEVTETHSLRMAQADAAFQYATVLAAQGRHVEAVPYYSSAFSIARGSARPVVAPR